jgi:tRNA 2-selenouridine synthase
VLRIEASLPARVGFLLRDYDYAVADPRLVARTPVASAGGLQSNETLERWRVLVAAGDFSSLVEQLLTQHYDPHYQRSQAHNYASFGAAARYLTDSLDDAALDSMAAQVLATSA